MVWLNAGRSGEKAYTTTNMLLQFAIRLNFRNHNSISRQDLIQQVAAKVGPKHRVDLNGYDLLILIEVYKVNASVREPNTEYSIA
jgi:tRNA acetyltransferase TAN1